MRFTQRGVALVIVTVALMLTGLLVKEFAVETHTDAFGADNARDQMRAEMLARSALGLSELILRVQQTLDSPQAQQFLGVLQITDYADMFMQAFGGTPEEVSGAVGLAGDQARGFGAEIGAFGVKITTDDGRINVNCANGKTEYVALTQTLLDALYYFPAYDPVFQDPDAEGWRRDRRQQTAALMDFVDENTQALPPPGQTAGGAAEDYGYEGLADDYKAKNRYLDTVEELKLARGVDERFWTLFGAAFTVYGGCKLNVRALEDPRILAAVLYLTAKNPNDPVKQDGALLWYHAQAMAYARQSGFYFNSLEDFVEFAKDPEGQMSAGLGGAAAQAAGAQPIQVQIPGVPVGLDLGVELDLEAVRKVLRAGAQRTYRVETWGEITRAAPFPTIRRELTAVWDMGNVNTNQRSPDARERNGAWLFLAVE
jgi:hypothetical protein